VAPWKQEVVDGLLELFNRYPVVGVLDISELPALQFQQIRQKLRDKAEIVVSKNTLMALALQRAARDKDPRLGDLAGFLRGQCALIFSNINSFKLSKFLRDNKINAPAKPGSLSTKDIVIPAGETDFAPGPVVGELQHVGIKARIQAGKVVILEDCHVLKRGDVITKEVSDALAKFGIMPLELGLKLRATYEAGTIFTGEVLEIDESKVLMQFKEASISALNLALNVNYPTSVTISLIIAKASAAAQNLALNACLPVSQVMPMLIARSCVEMLSLAAVIGAKEPRALDEELRAILGLPASPEAKSEEKPEEEPKIQSGENPKEG
jgi:large subunit ribosomal protein L10